MLRVADIRLFDSASAPSVPLTIKAAERGALGNAFFRNALPCHLAHEHPLAKAM